MENAVFLKEVSSTNDYLSGLVASNRAALADGFVALAENQTAGRGQAANVWESDSGENLTFSMALFPDFLPVREQFLISQVVSLGVVDFLDDYCKIGAVSIKWPNDIYWMDFKVCGILIENAVCGRELSSVVAGVGLNMNQTIFRGDAPNPISVSQITGEHYDLEAALEVLREKIMRRYEMLRRGEKEALRQSYLKRLYRQDGFYPYQDAAGTFHAEIEDVEPIGTLLLRLDNGELRRYAFKEVSFI